MRGRKIDNVFVAKFMEECLDQGITTVADMVKQAKQEIAEIDQQIQAVEQLKISRSQLLGVIDKFDKPTISNDKEMLSLYSLSYPQICQEICQKVNVQSFPIQKLSKNPETNFSIKQLLQMEILTLQDKILNKGTKFDDYLNWIT